MAAPPDPTATQLSLAQIAGQICMGMMMQRKDLDYDQLAANAVELTRAVVTAVQAEFPIVQTAPASPPV